MENKTLIMTGMIFAVIIGIALLTDWAGASSSTEDVTKNKDTVDVEPAKSAASAAPVKEFAMESYTEIIDGKYHPKFSLSEITVNKGDKVRIKITVTSGKHDFKIDEFGVYAETPLNKEVIVEFTADKTGEFVYYCAMPGHRAAGQWGTLKVIL